MLTAKVAIITGAASGIGRALGEELARRGSRVVLTDVKKDQVNEVADKIQKTGLDARAFTLDVSDFDAVNNLVADIVSDYGRIDYMFNNAGIAVGGEVRDISIPVLRRMNVRLPFCVVLSEIRRLLSSPKWPNLCMCYSVSAPN